MTGYKQARRVACVEDPGQEAVTYVAKVPDGEPVVLRGSAALIWDAATLGAHPLDSWAVAQVVADQVGVQAEDIHEDIQVFLAQLVEGGFLEVVP